MKNIDIKVGDIITAYQKGFHLVYKIEKRKNITPLVYYTKVLDKNFQECKQIKQRCDAAWCKKITIEKLKQDAQNQHKSFITGMKKLEKLIEDSKLIDWEK